MKNILVKSLFKINSSNWEVLDRSAEKDLYNKYLEMHEMSLKSFEKNLIGEWEYVFIDGEFDTIHQALNKTFYAIRELWLKNAPCNILYTDPDTLAIAPISIWGEYDKFMMFAYSDPKTFYKPNAYGINFPNFFNAGVRYFPASMKESTWQVGLELADRWNFDDYDTEQIILNQMLWSQDIKLHQALNPVMAYQAHWFPNIEVWRANVWNGTDINGAKILHLHGSRDIDSKLSFMRSVYKSI